MKRICHWSALLLLALFMLPAAGAAEGEIIASYYDCWRPDPLPGWRVLTNSKGAIGNAGNYEPLSYVNESPEKWTWGANYYTDAGKTIRAGTYQNRLPRTRDGVKRYAISAFTFSEDHAGDVWVTQGNLQGRTRGTGMDLRIYLNDTLKFEKVAGLGREPYLFQCNLGAVRKGDVVHVAVASEDANTLMVRLLYTVESVPQGALPPPPVQKINPPADAATPVLSSRTLRPDPAYLETHAELCQALLEQKPELVFIGDSITRRLGTLDMLSRRFGERFKPGLFAISGDWIQNVLWRIRNGVLDRIKPRAIVLLIGTNNVTAGYTVEEILRGIERILQTLRELTPDTHVVLMGIFPRGESIHDNPRYETIRQVNANLAGLAEKTEKVVFLDIGERLVEPDGTISLEIMPDRLHVSSKGLDFWAEALVPVLDKIFGNT